MNHKKAHHDRIDIFFLLNQKQILTKSEFNNILPLQNYEEYQRSFYKRKLSDFFLKNYQCDWFYGTYLERSRVLKYHTFQVEGEYLVIHSVSNYHTESTLRDILSRVEGVVDFTLFRPDPTRGFRRDCYVKMEGVDIESKFEEVRIGLNDFKIEFSRVEIEGKEEEDVEEETKDLDTLMNITKSLCKLYNTTLEEVSEIQKNVQRSVNIGNSPHSPNSPLFYLSILKNIFLYDYSTSQQFLSPLEFKVNRNHKKESPSSLNVKESRRRELALTYSDFSYVKNISFDFLLPKTIEKREERVFMCLLCEKRFESEDFTKNHQRNKHSEDLKKREEKYKHFSTFINSLDIFMLNLVEGSFEETPWFFKKRDEKIVVYDMNHVFSGDIKI